MNADTSLATLLTIANAVVTRRRAEVCTLPLSLWRSQSHPAFAPGPRSSHPLSRVVTSVIPSCLGDVFCTSSGGCFRSALAGHSQPSVSVSRLLGQTTGHSALSRKCSKTASSGMHATPVSFRLRQNPLAADLHRQALAPIGIPVLPQEPSGHSGSAVFRSAFALFPSCRLSASRHPERWREPHYSAFDRYRRCNSAASLVCMLPLSLQVETEPPGRLPPAPGSHRG
jgi:hypothetical protein